MISAHATPHARMHTHAHARPDELTDMCWEHTDSCYAFLGAVRGLELLPYADVHALLEMLQAQEPVLFACAPFPDPSALQLLLLGHSDGRDHEEEAEEPEEQVTELRELLDTLGRLGSRWRRQADPSAQLALGMLRALKNQVGSDII